MTNSGDEEREAQELDQERARVIDAMLATMREAHSFYGRLRPFVGVDDPLARAHECALNLQGLAVSIVCGHGAAFQSRVRDFVFGQLNDVVREVGTHVRAENAATPLGKAIDDALGFLDKKD